MEYGPVHSVENHPKWCDEKESENDSREGNSYMLHDSHVHCGSGKSAIEKATRRRPLLSNHNCPSTVLIGCNGVFWAYCRLYGSYPAKGAEAKSEQQSPPHSASLRAGCCATE